MSRNRVRSWQGPLTLFRQAAGMHPVIQMHKNEKIDKDIYEFKKG